MLFEYTDLSHMSLEIHGGADANCCSMLSSALKCLSDILLHFISHNTQFSYVKPEMDSLDN